MYCGYLTPVCSQVLRSSLSLLLFLCFVLRFLGRWFGLCEKLPEAVEPARHTTAALGHPIGERSETARLDLISAHASDLFALDESALLQHLKMLDHRREGHVELPRQVADRCRSAAQPLDDGPAGGFRESPEAAVDVQILKH